MSRPDISIPERPCPPAAPQLFIDALNVAYWCGKPASLRVPIALLAQLLIQGRSARLCFDASAPYQLQHEAGLYARLKQQQRYLIEVPSGIPADRVMLKQATSSGASILSRDRFRDHRRRYRRLIDDPARLISGHIQNDRLLVPALALDASLPPSIEAAWQQLEPLLIV